ncbi:MAG TPA: hypothetical protein VKB58_02505 [Terriglobales bacterium]|jgi:hypothetical protein|nr:hypothetical protein [Terriglobales bacterium]
MRLRRLLIPERFQDGYLYRQWFIGLTEYRSLKFVHLPSISSRVLRLFEPPSGQADMGERSPGAHVPEAPVVLTTPEVLAVNAGFAREVDLVVNASVVLDISVYRQHLYIGTDKGLFSAPLQLSSVGKPFRTDLERRHDARALKVTARFDTVTVSCGEDGLFAALKESEDPHEKVPLRKIEEQSLKSAWLLRSLVNYPSHREWNILGTREEEWAGGGEERWRAIGFPEDQRFGLSSLLHIIRQHQPDFNLNDVQFSFNSDRYIFVHTFGGEFFSLRLGHRHGEPKIYFHRTYKGTGVRILSATPLDTGLAIETNHRVFLFTKEHWIPLVDRDVLSVRTFPSSQRFRNIISIATEDGLYLISALPDKINSQP